MTRRWVNYKIINGFRVVSQWRNEKGSLVFTVICKVCNAEFDRAFSTLNKYKTKSCGCVSSQIKTLEEYVNGFKIIKSLGSDSTHQQRVEAQCKVCDRNFEVTATKLRYNKSCGCLTKKGKPVSKYGKHYPRLMAIYSGMLVRCYNEKCKAYKNYGARGIVICDEWLNNSNRFCEWSLLNGYADTLTIDRIDNDKGYYPENCRWTSYATQARNTRWTKMTIELAREIRASKLTSAELADKYKLKVGMIYDIRLNRTWRED